MKEAYKATLACILPLTRIYIVLLGEIAKYAGIWLRVKPIIPYIKADGLNSDGTWPISNVWSIVVISEVDIPNITVTTLPLFRNVILSINLSGVTVTVFPAKLLFN